MTDGKATVSLGEYTSVSIDIPEQEQPIQKEEPKQEQDKATSKQEKSAPKEKAKTKQKKQKEVAKKGGVARMLNYARKGEILDKASADIRRKHEALQKQAKEAGVPVSEGEIRKMRNDEGKARAKVLKGILKEKFQRK